MLLQKITSTWSTARFSSVPIIPYHSFGQSWNHASSVNSFQQNQTSVQEKLISQYPTLSIAVMERCRFSDSQIKSNISGDKSTSYSHRIGVIWTLLCAIPVPGSLQVRAIFQKDSCLSGEPVPPGRIQGIVLLDIEPILKHQSQAVFVPFQMVHDTVMEGDGVIFLGTKAPVFEIHVIPSIPV